MKAAISIHTTNESQSHTCKAHLRAINDTLDIVGGKWKIAIIGALSFGTRRFMELQREIDGIGAKMLSKELQELQMNEIVNRTVIDTKPISVEYAVTDYGRTLVPLIEEMAKWGQAHRARIMGNPRESANRSIAP